MKDLKNYEKIIDQFDMYVRRGVYNDWKLNDKFLRFMLDHSPTPSFQGRTDTKICPYTGKKLTVAVKVTPDLMTPEQEKELREVAALMEGFQSEKRTSVDWWTARSIEQSNKNYQNNRYAAHAKWTSADELRARIRKIPPVMQESILVIAIIIYLLRVLDADFDSETATFTTFFDNWHELIVGYYALD